MPNGPRGEKRPADVIGNTVKVMRIVTGEIEEESKPKSGRVCSGHAGAEARATKLTLRNEKRWQRKLPLRTGSSYSLLTSKNLIVGSAFDTRSTIFSSVVNKVRFRSRA